MSSPSNPALQRDLAQSKNSTSTEKMLIGVHISSLRSRSRIISSTIKLSLGCGNSIRRIACRNRWASIISGEGWRRLNSARVVSQRMNTRASLTIPYSIAVLLDVYPVPVVSRRIRTVCHGHFSQDSNAWSPPRTASAKIQVWRKVHTDSNRSERRR